MPAATLGYEKSRLLDDVEEIRPSVSLEADQ
jgi:hypothetical protein